MFIFLIDALLIPFISKKCSSGGWKCVSIVMRFHSIVYSLRPQGSRSICFHLCLWIWTWYGTHYNYATYTILNTLKIYSLRQIWSIVLWTPLLIISVYNIFSLLIINLESNVIVFLLLFLLCHHLIAHIRWPIIFVCLVDLCYCTSGSTWSCST